MMILTGDLSHAAAVTHDDARAPAAGGAETPHVPGAAVADRDLPEDARLYLRHVEGGETIRSLARETGCHASTILRRIRRFENRAIAP